LELEKDYDIYDINDFDIADTLQGFSASLFEDLEIHHRRMPVGRRAFGSTGQKIQTTTTKPPYLSISRISTTTLVILDGKLDEH
jgi:hypothetical protein